MRRIPDVLLASICMAATAAGLHVPDCVPTQADPSTYMYLENVGGRNFYVYESSSHPLLEGSPIPGKGFLTGEGTFIYEELNDLEGLQRDDLTPLLDCLPQIGPCLIMTGDTIGDVTCGHGADELQMGFRLRDIE